MNDHHRYQPYYHVKNYNDKRYEDGDSNDFKRHQKRNNSYYQSSSRRDERSNYRNNKDFSHRRSHKNDYRSKHSQSKQKNYTSFSTPPPSLLSLTIAPPPLPPLPPPPPPPPVTVVPHERESWIRSVKKTKTNESTEQKTQYLETMLRMPQQQKSMLNPSKFDRMRFADNRSLSTNNPTVPMNTDDLTDGSFHLVDDVHDHDDICTLEKILFNNDLNTSSKTSIDPCPIPTTSSAPCSGFLIDDCDDEEQLPPPSPPVSLLPSVTLEDPSNELDHNESRVLLLHELDDADAEQRKELKRQKRLQKKFKAKKSVNPPVETVNEPTSTTHLPEKGESSSDWVIEYNAEGTDSVSRLTDEIRQSTNTMTDEERTTKMNFILMKIKKQQTELKKLRQYVMSVLGEQSQRSSTSKNRSTNNNILQDLLLALLNQSTQNGCWLCSGKMYSEMGTQSDSITES